MNPVARIALVALLATPTVVHGIYRGGESAWVLAALFLAPLVLGRRDPLRVLLIGGVGAWLSRRVVAAPRPQGASTAEVA